MLDESCLVQDVDKPKMENDIVYLCSWVWVEDPDSLPKAIHIQLEEPLSLHSLDFCYGELGEEEPELRRTMPPKMPAYQVLIHLDQVRDFDPPLGEPVGRYSLDS